jgi:hypothetical protein
MKDFPSSNPSASLIFQKIFDKTRHGIKIFFCKYEVKERRICNGI